MITTDDDSLVCDMAETYRIYDYRALPPGRAAVLACGLRDDSRIKMKLQEMSVPLDTLFLAAIADRLGLQLWANSKDARHNRNRPESIAEKLLQGHEEDKVNAYRSAADFDAEFSRLTGGE
jgi:hypothetical protein